MSKRVTTRNFVQAETAHHFAAQSRRAPVNAYHHERDPVDPASPGAIRPNLDVLYSHAVVDVSEEATIAVAPSGEYQADQVIDEQHYVVGVVRPGETLRLTNAQLSSGTHVYVLGRTALAGGLRRAHELQDLRTITSRTANPYRPEPYDDASRLAVGARLERDARELDPERAFGTRRSTDREQHLLGTRVGWGTLPVEHGRYFEGVATCSGCDTWTFEVPPVEHDRGGFYSIAKYDERGRLADDHARIAGSEMMRNGDGTVSVYFGDDTCVATGNVIRTAAGERFRYAMRIYRPRDADETRRYVDRLADRGLRRVLN
ncbi:MULTISPECIES: DUF1254 domain-containing protein [unclassified Agromyces]|uniref:DUF1254 domain-containing protein n=1 Tax=unclassified Agromyces TaxID=2639701 RepID=UPI003014FF9F